MLHKLELVILILLITGFVVLNNNIGKLVMSDKLETKENVVALDAGHGGRDPGKIGVNGVLEKDINLQITCKVKELLENDGIKVVMIRESDTDMGTKREDMAERTRKINESKADFAVSIHQNSYTSPDVSGAQVFYYQESDEGKHLAEILQKELLTVDKNNKRQAKANENYFLLKKAEIPVVIVECGFLSNPQEAGKLVTEEYQDLISNAIVRGIESCFAN